VTTNQLLAICLFFLGLEERAKFENRQPLARWARRMYERYRDRLDRVRAGEPDAAARSYRPARGLEPEEVTP
jgi:hypothetical protein